MRFRKENHHVVMQQQQNNNKNKIMQQANKLYIHTYINVAQKHMLFRDKKDKTTVVEKSVI